MTTMLQIGFLLPAAVPAVAVPRSAREGRQAVDELNRAEQARRAERDAEHARLQRIAEEFRQKTEEGRTRRPAARRRPSLDVAATYAARRPAEPAGWPAVMAADRRRYGRVR